MYDKAVYSVGDLAKLGFGSRSHIYRLIEENKIPSIKLGKRIHIPGLWVKKNYLGDNMDDGSI